MDFHYTYKVINQKLDWPNGLSLHLQGNIYIIVIDMKANIRIDRLPKGHGMGQCKWYCMSQRQEQSAYPDIALHISNYFFYCIEESYTHNINAQKFFKESRNLIGTAIWYADIDGPKTVYRPVAPVYTQFLHLSVSLNSQGHMESSTN